MERRKRLLKLFISTLYISAFTFGGGYVIMSFMKKKYVDEYKWIDSDEMLDLIAIAQSSPGAVAVNGAIVIGYKIEGLVGALTAIIGTILPPFFIISIMSVFYMNIKGNVCIEIMLEGMQAGVGALIASVTVDMLKTSLKPRDYFFIITLIAAFVSTYIFGINVIYVIILCIILGIIRYFMKGGLL